MCLQEVKQQLKTSIKNNNIGAYFGECSPHCSDVTTNLHETSRLFVCGKIMQPNPISKNISTCAFVPTNWRENSICKAPIGDPHDLLCATSEFHCSQNSFNKATHFTPPFVPFNYYYYFYYHYLVIFAHIVTRVSQSILTQLVKRTEEATPEAF